MRDPEDEYEERYLVVHEDGTEQTFDQYVPGSLRYELSPGGRQVTAIPNHEEWEDMEPPGRGWEHVGDWGGLRWWERW